jgi:S1-C subfamily serine protease
MPATRPTRVVVTGTLLLLLGVAACSSSSSSSSSSTPTSASPRGGSSSSSTSLPSLSCGGGTQRGSGSLATQATASKVVDAVVNMTVTLSQGESADSGMIVSPTGEVLTVNHAIAGATSIKVVIGGRGIAHTAHVLGYDVVDDIAMLQIDVVSNLKTVPFGDSSKVKVGGLVVAIGNDSRGGPPVSTRGKVTALNPPVGANAAPFRGMLRSQLNVPVAGGGGPLVNAHGDVIGMNDAQDSSGASFAIPINEAATVVAQICRGNTTDKVHIGPTALLGVQINNNATATTVPGGGHSAQSNSEATVISVESNSAAASAGIKTGDVITSINGKSIANSDALHVALTLYHPGDRVNVGWVDTSGARHAAVVKLGVGPPG